ncbi:HlyD family secretion protein [Prochlorococcus marinus]|uniref:HlyD family secretion protein n=1 Tax=Prochlorococcus marinus TaxID=1219 RepID=UPI001ADC455D|nr:HlyD family efflux transporter periplasmic adaptor subunit [Prochlorococcus marinus CUG1416]
MKRLKEKIKKISFLNKFNSFNDQELRYKPTLFWSQALLWAIIGSVGFGFVYSIIARIDEVVISRGELQAQGAERPIKAPFSSLIKSLNVAEGEKVRENQILIELDVSNFEAQYEGINSKLNSLLITKNIKEEIVDRLVFLNEEGVISLIELLEERDSLQKIEADILQVKAKVKELEFELDRAKLVSPANGTVFNLIPSNEGYYASSGETLLLIVPEGDLEAKIFLSNKDVGFVRPNMNAEIRVDAFPFTQFGSIKGVLKSIGQESLPPDKQNSESRFPALVELNKQFLELNSKKYKLKSGQSVSVNLIVRDKPLITLLTDSIEKAFDALRRIKSDRK